MTEVFKSHPIYTNHLVGDKGTVISVRRAYHGLDGKTYYGEWNKTLKPIPTQREKGCKTYNRVNITKDGVSKQLFVHRLVLETYVSLMPIGCDRVNHKDGDPLNNNISNLEWCSAAHNTKHAIKTGLMPDNYRKHAERTRIKIKVYDKLRNKDLGIFESINDVSNKLGLNVGYISEVSRGNKKSTKYDMLRV